MNKFMRRKNVAIVVPLNSWIPSEFCTENDNSVRCFLPFRVKSWKSPGFLPNFWGHQKFLVPVSRKVIPTLYQSFSSSCFRVCSLFT
ncbi:caspase 7, isoform CRA_a [Rattus norvegicus]|uniref:Caspase 7, isoform CRA_a n=1 Tax=Rattus norvegicus TaxID=10116 RepID=A6JI20_RAT|nr:caspase 7, isoform CRA_a [Rattus norvegicus]